MLGIEYLRNPVEEKLEVFTILWRRILKEILHHN
jgi:hypothetical protein